MIYAVLTADIKPDLTPAELLKKSSANIVKFEGLLLRYSKGAVKQGYYLQGLEDLVTRDQAWLEVLPKVS